MDEYAHASMTTLEDAQSILSTYQHYLLQTQSGIPLQPIPLKTESLSYPSPTGPIGAHIPLISSPSTMNTVGKFDPSSSSPNNHPSALTINTKSNSIYLDAKFYSFEEFRLTLDEWMNLNYHPFRVASSEMLRESEGTLNSTFRYRYIVYHCAHYGNPRRRGAGKRPNQNYLPCGCTANLRLNYSFTDHCLKITTLKIEHTNHEISAESFAKCAIKLKKSPCEDTPIAPKKAKKRAASSCTDDSGVGFSPVTKKIKRENDINTDLLSELSPVDTSTPPSEGNALSDCNNTRETPGFLDTWIPPPNLPAPTPCRPTPTYPSNLFPFLQMQLMNNQLNPLFSFPQQYQMGSIHSPLDSHINYKFNEGPSITPVQPSNEDKENNEIIDVENAPPSSPQEYATLQPVKSEPIEYDTFNIDHTLTTLQSHIMSGSPNIVAARQAELQSLIAKWGTPTQSI